MGTIQGDGSVTIVFAIAVVVISGVCGMTYTALSLESRRSAIKSCLGVFAACVCLGTCHQLRVETGISLGFAVILHSLICFTPCALLSGVGSISARAGLKHSLLFSHAFAVAFAALMAWNYVRFTKQWLAADWVIASTYSLLGWGLGFVICALMQSGWREALILVNLLRRQKLRRVRRRIRE